MQFRVLAFVGGAVIAAVMAVAAAAQSTDIESTIDRQLTAFKADDFKTAFSFATPNLQRLFQTPENFRRMVTQGYPMVWRPAEVQYLGLSDVADAMLQNVAITDGKGQTFILEYRMEQTQEGWRIGGVRILEAPKSLV